mmetsp:Transcript_20020/g.35725  ORF Transcript_20020/g.35725 Transcript_20020/m.35725 type:complete len:202 (+) Transcript_20020:1451-2056(+)
MNRAGLQSSISIEKREEPFSSCTRVLHAWRVPLALLPPLCLCAHCAYLPDAVVGCSPSPAHRLGLHGLRPSPTSHFCPLHGPGSTGEPSPAHTVDGSHRPNLNPTRRPLCPLSSLPILDMVPWLWPLAGQGKMRMGATGPAAGLTSSGKGVPPTFLNDPLLPHPTAPPPPCDPLPPKVHSAVAHKRQPMEGVDCAQFLYPS